MATVTRTIGTVGRDYATATLWEADLDNGAIYAAGDDAVGECYNDSFLDEEVTLNGGHSIGLNSVKLTSAAADRHDGTNSGSSIKAFKFAPPNSNVDYVVEGLTVNGNNNISSLSPYDDNISSWSSAIIRNCVIHDHRFDGTSAFYAKGAFGLIGNIIYDIRYSDGGGGTRYIVSGASNRQLIAWSNTVHGCSHAGPYSLVGMASANSSSQCKNNIVTGLSAGGSVTNFYSGGWGSKSHNASEDGSAPGANSVSNLTVADTYVSTVVGSEDLHLKTSAVVIGGGSNIGTGNGRSIDINGIDRSATFGGQTWDIGAHQCRIAARIGSAGTGRDYATPALWEADLDDTTKYGNSCHAIGEMYNDSTFDTGSTISLNGGSVTGLSLVELTAASGEAHDGTAGTGAEIRSLTPGIVVKTNGSGRFYKVNRLEVNGNKANGAEVYNDVPNSHRTVFEKLIIHGIKEAGGSAVAVVGAYNRRTSLFNSIVYDIESTSTSTGAGATGVAAHNHAYFYMYGCNVHDVRSPEGHYAEGSGSQSTDITRRNCIITGTLDGQAFTGGDQYSTYGNISEDATGPGADALTGVLPTDLYVSTISGSEDFHLKPGSPAIDHGGDASAYYLDDIAGLTRELPYDSGAFLYVSVGSAPVIEFAGFGA